MTEGNKMTTEGSETPTLSKLVSAPGIAALAILGAMILAVSRLFGADTIVREVVTEVVASFGNAILLLAVFSLFFRSGLERLLRRAPGGDAYVDYANRMREILQDLDQRDQGMREPNDEARLNRIEEGVLTLANEKVPDLRNEIRELRELIQDPKYGRENQ